VKRGDNSAFETLVRQYQKPIYNVVYRMLHDREDSRDVTQTVFLKAFEKIDQYDPDRKFFSWICRIAINEAINRQARSRPEVAMSADASARGGTGAAESEAGGPGEELAREELRRGLEAALMRLDEDHRSVVVLRHIADMSYRDISATLEVSEKTVKSRLFIARQKMRGRLKRGAYL
jgi:RNA polymerase sigma-70 factor (ECF subfamily)